MTQSPIQVDYVPPSGIRNQGESFAPGPGAGLGRQHRLRSGPAELCLDGHPLPTHRFLYMEPEDEPVEIPQPGVLSALQHRLTRVCHVNGADTGLGPGISERRIKRDQLSIVLQQCCLPWRRTKRICGKSLYKRRQVWSATALIATVDGGFRDQHPKPREVGIL